MYFIAAAIFMNFFFSLTLLQMSGLVAAIWSVVLSMAAMILLGVSEISECKRYGHAGMIIAGLGFIALILKLMSIY